MWSKRLKTDSAWIAGVARLATAAVLALIPNGFYSIAYKLGWAKFIHAFDFSGLGLLWDPFVLNFLLALPFVLYARHSTRVTKVAKKAYVACLGVMSLVCFWPSVSLVLIMTFMSRWSRP